MATVVQQSGNTGASPATLVITMGASMTAGNLVVVCAEENDNATGPTIASTNVVFTKQNRFIGDGTHDNSTLWTGVIGSGAGATITITPNGANLGNVAAIAAECAGVQQVVDGTPPTPTNVASATPNVTSNTPSASGDLVLAFCGHTDATAPTATPSGWTALTRRAGNNSIEGAWEVNSGSSTQNASWTFAASKNALLQIVLVLASAAGGGPQPTGGTPIAQFIPGLPTFSPLLQTFPDSPSVQTLPDPSRFLNPLAPTLGLGLYSFQRPYYPPSVQLFLQGLDATAVAVTASMQRQTNKGMTATAVAVTASFQKQVNKILSATAVAVTASIQKQVNKTLSATAVVVTASLQALKVILKAMSATVVVTASIQKQVNKALTATAVAVTASIQKQVNKTLTATTVAVTASLQALKVIVKAMTATAVVVSASMSRQVQFHLSATVSLSASIVKRISKTLSATASLTASLVANFVGPIVGPFAAAVASVTSRLYSVAVGDSRQTTSSAADAAGFDVQVTDASGADAASSDGSGYDVTATDPPP